MELLFIPVVMLLALGPVIALAWLGSDSFALDTPGRAGVSEEHLAERTPAMLRVRSPLKLGALRTAGCGLVLAPVAALQDEHVVWLVLAGHAALSVATASFIERWAALRRSPLTGAALAGAAAVLLMTAGVFQAHASAELFLGRGSAVAIMSDPTLLSLSVLKRAAAATFYWGVPCAAITYGQLTPGPSSHPVLIAALFTFCAGWPAAFGLAACYFVSALIEGWLPREPGGA